jgi:hypothetical protein
MLYLFYVWLSLACLPLVEAQALWANQGRFLGKGVPVHNFSPPLQTVLYVMITITITNFYDYDRFFYAKIYA